MRLSKARQFFTVFFAFLIVAAPFKVMVLVEGFTEVRPAGAIPLLAGLVCGPIGAIACGFGNSVADLFGTFNLTTLLGLVGNGGGAWLSWRLWHIYRHEAPNVHNNRNILFYIFISLVTALAIAWICGFGLYYLFGSWMDTVYIYIFFNNFGFSVALGLPIFIMLTSDEVDVQCCPPPKRWLILRNARLRIVVPLVFAGIMLALCACVLGFGFSPADTAWFQPLSLAALVCLIAILV